MWGKCKKGGPGPVWGVCTKNSREGVGRPGEVGEWVVVNQEFILL